MTDSTQEREVQHEAVWGDDVGVYWENATEAQREQFALVRLYWFFRMVACGGPDGSELDDEVENEARVAADWLGTIFNARAEAAS